MNTITITGRLTLDPVRRIVVIDGENRTVTTLAVAVDDHHRDDPCFIDVVVWGRSAEACATHLHKGRKVAVAGRLDLSRWTSEDGTKHQRHQIVAAEVEFLDRPASGERAA